MKQPLVVYSSCRIFAYSYLFILLVFFSLPARAQLITTFAGSSGYGDGAAAIGATVAHPAGVAVGSDGTLYIADTDHHRIRKVAPDGTISTIAGTGKAGFRGDNGSALIAQLASPVDVVLDATGNLYVSDAGNLRIRKITTSGIISTIAGNGGYGYSGDGGMATLAPINGPFGIAVDGSGNLYIADLPIHRIRKVSPDGLISTVAGNGTQGFSGDGGLAKSAQLSNPIDVAIDGSGNLYIAERGNYRVRKVSASGIISTAAGTGTQGFAGDGGPAESADLNDPIAMTLDGLGNLYIATHGDSRIRKITTNGIIATLAGTGSFGYSGDGEPATNANLSYVFGMAVDGTGNLYIADLQNNRIRKIADNGTISTTAGNGSYAFGGDNGLATSASLAKPFGVAQDRDGNLYIADVFNSRIRKVTPQGIISTVAGTGIEGFSGDGSAATSAALNTPSGVTVDGNGNLYIADAGNSRIRRVTPDGIISTVVGTGIQGFSGDGAAAINATLFYPVAVTIDGSGNLYIADQGNHRIRKVTLDGIISTVAGNGTQGFSGDGGAAVSAALSAPAGLAIDSNGILYIGDTNNSRLRKVTADGTIFTIAGMAYQGYTGDNGPAVNATLRLPSAVVPDGKGNLYIADTGNNVIRKITPDGIIRTVAGNGLEDFTGDGGLATKAALQQPKSLVVDKVGNLLIADADNNRIRRVSAPPGTDLTPNLVLPQATFPSEGSVRDFVVNLFEVSGLPTAVGKVAITITAPLGYTLSFASALTSIDVSGSLENPVVVSNPNWSVTSLLENRQISLVMKADQFIDAGGTVSLGFSLTRTSANSGSLATITVNVTDDSTKEYDGNSTNNVYARIISGL